MKDKLSDDRTRFVIPSRSKYYGPWIVEPKPIGRWRAAWRALRGRPVELWVHRALTVAGTARLLKRAYTPKTMKQLNSSPLLDALGKPSVAAGKQATVALKKND